MTFQERIDALVNDARAYDFYQEYSKDDAKRAIQKLIDTALKEGIYYALYSLDMVVWKEYAEARHNTNEAIEQVKRNYN